jgi:hypothetical protein
MKQVAENRAVLVSPSECVQDRNAIARLEFCCDRLFEGLRIDVDRGIFADFRTGMGPGFAAPHPMSSKREVFPRVRENDC